MTIHDLGDLAIGTAIAATPARNSRHKGEQLGAIFVVVHVEVMPGGEGQLIQILDIGHIGIFHIGVAIHIGNTLAILDRGSGRQIAQDVVKLMAGNRIKGTIGSAEGRLGFGGNVGAHHDMETTDRFFAHTCRLNVGIDGGRRGLIDRHIGVEVFEMFLNKLRRGHVHSLGVHEEQFMPMLFDDTCRSCQIVRMALHTSTGSGKPARRFREVFSKHWV